MLTFCTGLIAFVRSQKRSRIQRLWNSMILNFFCAILLKMAKTNNIKRLSDSVDSFLTCAFRFIVLLLLYHILNLHLVYLCASFQWSHKGHYVR